MLQQVQDRIRDAAARHQAMEIVGHGSKRFYGETPRGEALDMRTFSGISSYEPTELVVTAKAGTPIAELEALLAEHGQCLAFEPPDLSRLLGAGAGQTIGGVVATNLSGPRRISAGAARDHVLGLRAVNGRGEIFRAGGKVVKNVTGYDLPKLLTGSFGTMAVFTELTLKVLPAAETEETIVLSGLDCSQAVTVMCQALGSSAALSGAAWVPGTGVALRLEGFGPSVEARRQRLLALLGRDADVWGASASKAWWREIRDLAPLGLDEGHAVWKISLPATQAPAFLEKLKSLGEHKVVLDWGGALVWVSLPCGADAKAGDLRALLPPDAYAMLMIAPAPVRASQPVFQPRPAAQMA
ncbi:MAG: glycolate oxidase subunit GlcE, partial [Paucibacter sp.]|nr:glycolate oxidase subunit GlcE [Roseateles sp.]